MKCARFTYMHVHSSMLDFSNCNKRQCAFKLFITVIVLALAGTCVWYLVVDPKKHIIELEVGSSKATLKAIYKCAYENRDGTVDLVFNIPQGGGQLIQLNDLKRAPWTPFSPNSTPEQLTAGTNETVKVASRPSVKTKYPISLEVDYLINTIHVCPMGQAVDYLIIVHSATPYFNRRRAIRETFGGRRLFGHITQRVVFLLGTTSDPVTSRLIREEAITHRDIVQGPFVDSYHNLTHKGVLGFRWISEHCQQAKMVVKIDDDVFVNPFLLVERILPAYANKSRHILCHLRRRGTSPIERGKGRWQVTEDEFKDLNHFPFDYCNGYVVVMTSDLIRPLLNAARVNPFFWIDDVYLFGMLPATVGRTNFVDLRANLTLRFQMGHECYSKLGADCNILAVSQWVEKEADTLWYMTLQNLTEATKKRLHLFGTP